MEELDGDGLANQDKLSELRTGYNRQLLKDFLQEDDMIYVLAS